MTPKQVTQLTDRINDWYGTKLAPNLVAHVWVPGLEAIPADVAVDALKHYARKQRGGYAPSLDDLLRHCEEVQDERHRTAIQERRLAEDRRAAEAWSKACAARAAQQQERTTAGVVSAVLHDAAHDPWAYGHVEMDAKGLNKKGREQEAAAFCWRMAEAQPDNRDAWLAEGAWWERGATGSIAWATPMSHGGRIREPGDDDQ